MGVDASKVEDKKNLKLKSQKSKFQAGITGGIAIFAIALFMAGFGKAEAAEANQSDAVKHKLMSFDLEGLADSGKKKWDVKGQSAEAISEHEVKLDSIVASAYGQDAQATITADKGVYDKTKNNVRLEQNVRATIESSRDKNS